MRHVVLSGAIARVNHAARAGRDNLGTITAALLLGLASLACALLVSYRINDTSPGDSSSTDDSRLRGALPIPDSCSAAKSPLFDYLVGRATPT